MLKIRLQRVGRKHEPLFRLVLTDSKNGPKSGKFLEILGSFDARNAEKAEFKKDRVEYWHSKGAQLSATTHNLLVTRKVLSGKKINVLPKMVVEAEKNKKIEAEKKALEDSKPKEVASAPDNTAVETDKAEAEVETTEQANAEPSE